MAHPGLCLQQCPQCHILPFGLLLLEPFAKHLESGEEKGRAGLCTTQTPTIGPGPTSTSCCSWVRPSLAPTLVLLRRRWGAAKGGRRRRCRAPWQRREERGRVAAGLSWQRLPCPCPTPQSRYCQAPRHLAAPAGKPAHTLLPGGLRCWSCVRRKGQGAPAGSGLHPGKFALDPVSVTPLLPNAAGHQDTGAPSHPQSQHTNSPERC